jgi:uncharacterized protein YkwD
MNTLLIRNSVYVLAIAMSIFTSCSKSSQDIVLPATAASPAKVATIDTSFSMLNNINQEKLLTLVNEARAKGCNCGGEEMPAVSPVKWSRTLERAAYMHANDMKDNNYFDHKNKVGDNGGVRIQSVGYPWSSWGENLAYGNLNEESVVNGWLRSPTHCKVLMTASFSEMGIAKAGNYWAQAFAKPK